MRQNEHYDPAFAEKQSRKRKRSCGAKRKILEGNELYTRIASKLRLDWSPEQIVHTVAEDVSVSTIYRAFHNKTLVPFAKNFRILTYQSGWKRTRKRGKSYKDAKTIHQRPIEVDDREEFGHWELDPLVFCKRERKALAVFLERKTRKAILILLDDKKAKTMKEAVISAFKDMPPYARKTITVDRGKEFELWKEIEEALPGTKIYFCDPMRPDQKGAVENTNGLLRQYYPKHKGTMAPSQTEIAAVQTKLSNRPRKSLNYTTPYQAFIQELEKCCT
jgi:IS30 family transposase